PGLPGQSVPSTFAVTVRNSALDEMGVFSVDSIDGNIAGSSPGEPGWMQLALTRPDAHVLFSAAQGVGTQSTVNLSGGGLDGLYLVHGGTTADLLAQNPNNQVGKGPVAYFSFVTANPDQFQHLRWDSINTFSWNDVLGGGNQDFTALEGAVSIGLPQG